MNFFDELQNYDAAVADACKLELERQQHNIELIASENIVSKAVLLAAGGVLTNKYAEGYPSKRYYGGCQCVDIVEEIARERAKKLFWRRSCKCSAPQRCQCKPCGFLCPFESGRYNYGNEPSAGRTSLARISG